MTIYYVTPILLAGTPQAGNINNYPQTAAVGTLYAAPGDEFYVDGGINTSFVIDNSLASTVDSPITVHLNQTDTTALPNNTLALVFGTDVVATVNIGAGVDSGKFVINARSADGLTMNIEDGASVGSIYGSSNVLNPSNVDTITAGNDVHFEGIIDTNTSDTARITVGSGATFALDVVMQAYRGDSSLIVGADANFAANILMSGSGIEADQSVSQIHLGENANVVGSIIASGSFNDYDIDIGVNSTIGVNVVVDGSFGDNNITIGAGTRIHGYLLADGSGSVAEQESTTIDIGANAEIGVNVGASGSYRDYTITLGENALIGNTSSSTDADVGSLVANGSFNTYCIVLADGSSIETSLLMQGSYDSYSVQGGDGVSIGVDLVMGGVDNITGITFGDNFRLAGSWVGANGEVIGNSYQSSEFIRIGDNWSIGGNMVLVDGNDNLVLGSPSSNQAIVPGVTANITIVDGGTGTDGINVKAPVGQEAAFAAEATAVGWAQNADGSWSPTGSNQTLTFGGITYINFESAADLSMEPDCAHCANFTIPSDGVVEGTAAADRMELGYVDADGDAITDGADSISGSDGNDTIAAAAGNDTITGGRGDDSIQGGAGNDSILGSEGSDTVDGGDGDDYINTRTSPGLGVPDTGLPHPTDPTLSYPADVDPNNDRDSVLGGSGNDTILTGDDADTVYGGTGDDVIDAGFDGDLVFGGSGADSIQGSEGQDTIDGGDENDVIYGGISPLDPNYTASLGYELTDDLDPDPRNNADLLIGGAGDDRLYGQDDADTLEGGTGNDTLDGGIDNDSLDGSAGNDQLLGGHGADTLTGGAGNDTLDLGGDDDFTDTVVLADGDGSDVVSGFEAPVQNPDGSYTSGDLFDVSNLTDANGNPINASDVTVGDDGNGNAVLTFPNGESITLIGVAPTAIDGKAELAAAGIPCFVTGTLIETIDGPKPIEDIKVGDLVETVDDGYQPVRWIGSRSIEAQELEANPNLRPIRIAKGALGNGLPERDLYVSPQHRMLISSKIAERMFAKREILVAAKQLVLLDGIEPVGALPRVTYVHMLFDRHQVVYAEGAMSESLYTGMEALRTVGRRALGEILTIFPELRALDPANLPPPARMVVKGRLGRKLALRHKQNEISLVG